MSFTVAWDETSPPGSQDMSLGDDRIREFKTQMRERVSVDHHFPSLDDANTGYHDKATFIEQGSDPLQVASTLILYAKAVSGLSELFSRHESAALQQLTLQGKLWISALGIASQAAGDISFFDGTIWNRLGIGTALQQLRANAGATAPEWFSPTALVQSEVQATNDVSISSSGTYALVPDMTLTFTSTGSRVMIYHEATYHGSTDTENIFQIQVDGVGVIESSAYYYGPKHVYFATIITPSAGSRVVTVKHKTGTPAASTFDQKGTIVRRVLGVCELPSNAS